MEQRPVERAIYENPTAVAGMQQMDKQALIRDLAHSAHVWVAETDTVAGEDMLAAAFELLSPEEASRCERFRFKADRNLYQLSHAMLRRTLSNYATVDPAAWVFSRRQHGRPEIDSPDSGLPLRFNLTHTRGLVACVVTRSIDCGVDAEQLAMRRHAMGIAERMFAREELQVLRGLSGQAFVEQFYACWTLREAYCKARGVGLANAGRHFHFEQNDSARWRICFDADHPAGSNWTLSVERMHDTHLLAVAVNANDTRIRMLEFDDWG